MTTMQISQVTGIQGSTVAAFFDARNPAFSNSPLPPPPPLPLQVNAELLTEEGKLLAGLQAAGGPGCDEGDYDMRAYAEQLEALLRRKHSITASLLEQIDKFKASLRHEEMVSMRLK